VNLKLSRLLRSLSRQPEELSQGVPTSARQAILRCHALLSERGEISGARLASDVLASYQSLRGRAFSAFFDLLAKEFSPDPVEVRLAGDAYLGEPSPANLIRLQAAIESPRQELFRRLNMAPGGTGVLVEMRRQLRGELEKNPQWTAIEADLVHLLSSWFNRGFLVLQRIDWRTSALILEKLIQYEAVHEIQGWRDLRRRLQADRRCYAFFHPALPDEPIIFIEVALTRGMSAKVQPLLDPESSICDPAAADCAIFYSITNCQEGLRGISFGSFLIKQVAEDLGREFPRLKTFATLSPIPGFRDWLAGALSSSDGDAKLTTFRSLLSKIDTSNWFSDEALSAELQRVLVPLCAHYLLYAKHGNEPLDPVARFHLGNGASLERVNWMGDTSVRGIRCSAGLTVNYVYRLEDVERNHETYAKKYEVIASHRLDRLAKQSLVARTGSASTSRPTRPAAKGPRAS
jgi:malonyl-CoA decarboxylase